MEARINCFASKRTENKKEKRKIEKKKREKTGWVEERRGQANFPILARYPGLFSDEEKKKMYNSVGRIPLGI